MSSFFTTPRTQKRKRPEGASDGPKKRFATSKTSQPSRTGPRSSNPRPNGRVGGPNGAPGGRPNGQIRESNGKVPRQQAQKKAERDSSISGSDSEDEIDSDDVLASDIEESSGSEAEGETAAERRIRLAERYLEGARQEVEDEYGFDAEELDRDILAERLQEDVAETKGKVYRKLTDELDFPSSSHTLFKWNSGSVNSVATCAPFLYTATGTDASLIKWRLQDLPKYQYPQTTRRKPKKPDAPPKKRPERLCTTRANPKKIRDKMYQGHTGPILTVAASADGKFVVTGGADKRIVVHDAETLKPLRAFTHHRDAVTGLAFRRGTNQLYSCSRDRTVKVWSLDELAYVETLFGHQDDVVDIDALAQERCVSVGARDKTARMWKVVEETQLLFRGGGGASSDRKNPDPNLDPKSLAHEGSVDRVAMLDDELFVTGGDNGAISLWSTQKKKPLFVVPRAHGLDPPMTFDEASAAKNPDPEVIPPPQPRWITALRAIPYSDLVLSGSWDGHVRVWRLSDDKKKLEAAGVLGLASPDSSPLEHTNGISKATALTTVDNTDTATTSSPLAKGIINDISTFERGDRGKDGLCVVIALGKEHRLGRWKTCKGGRNGAMVFEVPRRMLAKADAEEGGVGEDEDEDTPRLTNGERKSKKASEP